MQYGIFGNRALRSGGGVLVDASTLELIGSDDNLASISKNFAYHENNELLTAGDINTVNDSVVTATNARIDGNWSHLGATLCSIWCFIELQN